MKILVEITPAGRNDKFLYKITDRDYTPEEKKHILDTQVCDTQREARNLASQKISYFVKHNDL